MIEAILGVPLNQLTESDKNKVIQQLGLLLHDTKLVLNHIQSQLHSGRWPYLILIYIFTIIWLTDGFISLILFIY